MEDVKQVTKILWLFLPLPMFWALFNQQVCLHNLCTYKVSMFYYCSNLHVDMPYRFRAACVASSIVKIKAGLCNEGLISAALYLESIF